MQYHPQYVISNKQSGGFCKFGGVHLVPPTKMPVLATNFAGFRPTKMEVVPLILGAAMPMS